MPDSNTLPNIPQNPIFVVGYPRSGTTLLQALIATQPNVITFPETHFFSEIIRPDHVNPDGFIRANVIDARFDKLRSRIEYEIAPQTLECIRELAMSGGLTPKIMFELIVQQNLAQHADGSTISRSRWLEKTPNHVYHLERIFDLYPHAQFVNIIRNPFFAIYSRKKSGVGGNYSIDTLARLWKDAITAYEAFRQRHPAAIYSVQYEKLAATPLDVLGEVCNFLDIKPDLSAASKFNETAKGIVRPTEVWKQNNLAKDIKSTNETYHISILDTLNIQSVARSEMAKSGYPVSYGVVQPFFNRAKTLKKTIMHPLKALLRH